MGALQRALAAAGLPPEVLQVVRTDEGAVGRALVSHAGVDTVLLTGSIETARMFAGWRAGRAGGPRVLAETSGKNALVITPAADYDLAVADLVRSAFGHAGQKCSAASLAILVGSAATSSRLRRQLVDAVRSLRVGWPSSLGTTMGPVIEPPEGKLEAALTRLDPGERWLVEPEPLDESGRLWSPGLKEGVAPGSSFHRTECFGPVLGLMTADSLEQAVALQNGTAFGLTGGLHSLDEEEIERWLETVDVGNAYVNRHITGAIVRRQPFGGWKDSVVGPGAKAGGPNYVAQLGTWAPTDGLPSVVAEPSEEVRAVLDAAQRSIGDGAARAWLAAAAGSDAAAWAEELGRRVDRTGLAVEENSFRYRPVPSVLVRAGAGTTDADVWRLLLAGAAASTPVTVSADPHVAVAGVPEVRIESTEELIDRLATVPDGEVPTRIRALGADAPEVAAAVAALPDRNIAVLTGPVLATGRRELLTMLREQAISRTRHRFGHLPPDAG
jgi:RHH-type proline utilization regulon transcriptional repressor/proline dehydrogenase/delta 1-pyrroline-5-carboxylate dehydrogenase